MRRWLKRYNLPIVRRALSLMDSDRKKFVALIVMFCGVELAWTLTEPIGIRGAINALGAADLDAFWRAMPLVAVGKALWWIYAPIAAWGTAKITTGAICQYRADLLHHLLRLPMRFFDARQKGALLTTFDGDMRALERVYDRSFFQVLRSTVGGLANVAVMAAMDWRFALVVLALGALSIAASGKFARQLKAAGEEQQAGLAQTGAGAHQLVKSAKAIRLFGLQRGHAEQFSTSAGREEAARRRAGAIAARMNAALAAVNGLSYLAVLLVGALFVYRRLIDWGAVIALMGLRGGADMLFVEAGQFMAAMQVEMAGIARLFGVQDEREEGELPPNLVPGGDALAMEGVSFAYEGGAPVLDRFSMAVRRPGVAALIGESGRGKSTAMKLILGLYRPDEGEVTFAAEGAPATLRGQTAYVPQEPLLFRGTIFENIAAGRDGATMDDVVDAAKRAGAHQFILEKPDGYRTELLDDGGSLSGGQRQRIAIARALVKGAPVLLLDEPTSALDGEREAEIFDTIREIGREKAVLLISHRPAVRQWADRVYEMR